MYLLVTDFYSKYFEIEILRQNIAICVINNLKKIFARFGIPEKVVSDNGPQYSNTRNLFSNNHEFKKFAEEWGFSHTTSSPEYPQSNGAAERAVQTAKRILKKAAAENKDPFEGLLKYRNTPFEDIGVSPAQLLMSRRTRTMIPTHRRLLLPQPVDRDHVLKTLHQRQYNAKSNYDKQSRDLPPLKVGGKVWFRPNGERKWWKAEVMGSRDSAVVRALTFHQCGPGSIRGLDVICGLSLLLVLLSAPRGFSPGTPVFPSRQKPTFLNSNSIRNARAFNT